MTMQLPDGASFMFTDIYMETNEFNLFLPGYWTPNPFGNPPFEYEMHAAADLTIFPIQLTGQFGEMADDVFVVVSPAQPGRTIVTSDCFINDLGLPVFGRQVFHWDDPASL